MKWATLKDIFAFRPVVDDGAFFPVEDDNALHDPASTPALEPAREEADDRARNIRFDNAIRLWVSIPTYLTCLALRLGGAISTAWPMTAVFLSYCVLHYLVYTIYLNIRYPRSADYVLATLDLVAMSASVYFTGGAVSPIYFIYFVPLVVHAFHRDLNVVLYSGFGGVTLYGVAVLLSLSTLNPATIADLAARLVFMMLTVAIACLALSLLRRKDALDRRRLARLRAVSVVSHRLNHACSSKELSLFCGGLSGVLGAAVGGESAPAQVSLLLADPRLGSLRFVDAAPGGAPSDISGACPSFGENRVVRDHPNDGGLACHWNTREARSRLCVPISIDGGAAIGVLSAASSAANAFGPEEEKFLRMIAKSVALCAHRLEQMEELRRAVEMSSCVTAVFLESSHSTNAAHAAILEGTLALVEADQATLFVWDPDGRSLEAVACRGPRSADEVGMRFRSGEGLVGGVFEDREPRVSTNVLEDPAYQARRSAIKSMLAVPLRTIKGTVVGVLTISRVEDRRAFNESEIALASTFAHRAAHALQDANLHAQTRGGPHAEAA